MSRSKFGLGSTHLTTCDMGQVIPIGLLPVLPGDIIGQKTNALIRISPTAAPVMHKVDVRIHHFYAANRNLWDGGPGDNWEEFITGGEDGMNTDKIPTVSTTGTAKDLFDHFGIPLVSGVDVSALPVTMYNQVINEFYRDQDLQTKRLDTDVTIARCAWEKDYFSTARPWAAKGPSVSIPLGDRAEVATDAAGASVNLGIDAPNIGGLNYRMLASGADVLSTTVAADASGRMYADLSTATGADPLDVRRAWGIQRFMENAARFGSRYPEKMRQLGSMYKGLMDRPEFLAGGNQTVNFSEVLQTANDVGDRDFGVGDMYGHGIAAMRSNKYARRIDEHGFVMSLLSVRPRTLYQDGIDREWLREDREDFHDPYLEFVGQQEIWLNEIWALSANLKTDVFGFSDRYQEYRETNSKVSGEMRALLDYWHLGRKFTSKPVLNDAFITCTPTKRVFNEQTQDSLWIMIHHQIAAHRNLTRSATARLT